MSEASDLNDWFNAGIVSADLIAAMKPHAVLVNISRGAVVDNCSE